MTEMQRRERKLAELLDKTAAAQEALRKLADVAGYVSKTCSEAALALGAFEEGLNAQDDQECR